MVVNDARKCRTVSPRTPNNEFLLFDLNLRRTRKRKRRMMTFCMGILASSGLEVCMKGFCFAFPGLTVACQIAGLIQLLRKQVSSESVPKCPNDEQLSVCFQIL